MLLYEFDYAPSKYNIKGSKTLFDILGGYFLKIESWKRIPPCGIKNSCNNKSQKIGIILNRKV